ncbi:MAG: hypothetical protein PUI48_11010 [Oscillospiraceae bacterium]|nr:hypothetical protein [Oscillospiraceae bacterium]MDY6209301.1 hypothetical protein [Oscillospiraceae bacterium]
MSFIAGYILGNSGRVREIDPRVRKLDETPTLWQFDVGEGWNVRVKIAYDVDHLQFFQFGFQHGGIVNYTEQWSIYYCVYLNDSFVYASCQAPFFTKYQENYQGADVPNRLYCIYEYTDFTVTSGKMTLDSGGTGFLEVEVSGTYNYIYTPYSWTDESDRIKGETVCRVQTFNASHSNFGGNTYGANYIVNGGADEFRQAVYGLFAVCRSRANL